ncbi:MAG: hypothetical protein IJJ50_05990 [Lachnospiraceae bacterium]|nr:hypothetical protein [Lachnospiraceae bacterium]
MKFYPVTSKTAGTDSLNSEYASAHPVGVIRVGSDHLFFRVRFRTYCIPFSDIKRAFRRVMEVPAKMCCGEGSFAIENLVLCDDGKELAVIQLPGTKAARLLMEELKSKMPDADFSAPAAKDNEQNG